MSLPVLRLIADDLTGALDTAAEFTGLVGPVTVRWDIPAHAAGSLALGTGTREATREQAFARVSAVAPLLAAAQIGFKKLDSLLRGHPAAELAACLQAGAWRSVVLAPAFPAQGRVTRGGQQFARQADGSWQPMGAPIATLLAEEGLACRLGDPASPLLPGISVFDAETEDDLRRIVASSYASAGPVLWCGSGGLGRAVAAGRPAAHDGGLHGPVLGLFGSDHPVTQRQLASCGALAIRHDGLNAAPVVETLRRHGAALVTAALPDGLPRDIAAARISENFAALLRALPAPGTLLVAGGETLGAVCTALGAEALEATGLVAPGVPRSILRGGAWDGVAVISKSGAFGGDTLWRDLLASNGFIADRQTA
jgi:uncharacterized protein YgbK (DUF1537 family)